MNADANTGPAIKAFRYRVYPTDEQAARFNAWNDALRALWNVANNQRQMMLQQPRDRRRRISAFDQINELTQLRAEAPWLEAVPRNVCAQLLVELDLAWQRAFKKLAKPPRFKKKGRDHLSFCEPHPKAWSVVDGNIRFPKVGVLRTVMHRPLEGKPKTCRVVRDGDAWFVQIACEVPVEHSHPSTSAIALATRDNALATSDGDVVLMPEAMKATNRRIARAERVAQRKKPHSKNRTRANKRVASLHRKLRRQRDHHLHVQSAHHAKNHSVVFVEDPPRRGTPEPITAKENTSTPMFFDAAWGRFAFMLDYKLRWSSGTLVRLPMLPPSSVEDAEPEAQHAAVTAARTLFSRGIHGGAACGGLSERKPLKQELSVVRRRSRRHADPVS